MTTPSLKRKSPARKKATGKKSVKIQINAKAKPKVKGRGSIWSVYVNRVISKITSVVRS